MYPFYVYLIALLNKLINIYYNLNGSEYISDVIHSHISIIIDTSLCFSNG